MNDKEFRALRAIANVLRVSDQRTKFIPLGQGIDRFKQDAFLAYTMHQKPFCPPAIKFKTWTHNGNPLTDRYLGMESGSKLALFSHQLRTVIIAAFGQQDFGDNPLLEVMPNGWQRAIRVGSA